MLGTHHGQQRARAEFLGCDGPPSLCCAFVHEWKIPRSRVATTDEPSAFQGGAYTDSDLDIVEDAGRLPEGRIVNNARGESSQRGTLDTVRPGTRHTRADDGPMAGDLAAAPLAAARHIADDPGELQTQWRMTSSQMPPRNYSAEDPARHRTEGASFADVSGRQPMSSASSALPSGRDFVATGRGSMRQSQGSAANHVGSLQPGLLSPGVARPVSSLASVPPAEAVEESRLNRDAAAIRSAQGLPAPPPPTARHVNRMREAASGLSDQTTIMHHAARASDGGTGSSPQRTWMNRAADTIDSQESAETASPALQTASGCGVSAPMPATMPVPIGPVSRGTTRHGSRFEYSSWEDARAANGEAEFLANSTNFTNALEPGRGSTANVPPNRAKAGVRRPAIVPQPPSTVPLHGVLGDIAGRGSEHRDPATPPPTAAGSTDPTPAVVRKLPAEAPGSQGQSLRVQDYSNTQATFGGMESRAGDTRPQGSPQPGSRAVPLSPQRNRLMNSRQNRGAVGIAARSQASAEPNPTVDLQQSLPGAATSGYPLVLGDVSQSLEYQPDDVGSRRGAVGIAARSQASVEPNPTVDLQQSLPGAATSGYPLVLGDVSQGLEYQPDDVGSHRGAVGIAARSQASVEPSPTVDLQQSLPGAATSGYPLVLGDVSQSLEYQPAVGIAGRSQASVEPNPTVDLRQSLSGAAVSQSLQNQSDGVGSDPDLVRHAVNLPGENTRESQGLRAALQPTKFVNSTQNRAGLAGIAVGSLARVPNLIPANRAVGPSMPIPAAVPKPADDPTGQDSRLEQHGSPAVASAEPEQDKEYRPDDIGPDRGGNVVNLSQRGTTDSRSLESPLQPTGMVNSPQSRSSVAARSFASVQPNAHADLRPSASPTAIYTVDVGVLVDDVAWNSAAVAANPCPTGPSIPIPAALPIPADDPTGQDARLEQHSFPAVARTEPDRGEENQPDDIGPDRQADVAAPAKPRVVRAAEPALGGQHVGRTDGIKRPDGPRNSPALPLQSAAASHLRGAGTVGGTGGSPERLGLRSSLQRSRLVTSPQNRAGVAGAARSPVGSQPNAPADLRQPASTAAAVVSAVSTGGHQERRRRIRSPGSPGNPVSRIPSNGGNAIERPGTTSSSPASTPAADGGCLASSTVARSMLEFCCSEHSSDKPRVKCCMRVGK